MASVVALCGLLAPEARAFTSQNANKVLADYLAAFTVSSGNSAYFRLTTATEDRLDFWKQAEAIEMVEDAYDRDGSASTRQMVVRLCNGFTANYGSDWSWNEYNDDIMWATAAFVRAHELTGNATFLQIAKSNFDMCFARAWDTANGGLWWRTDNTSKNSCVEGPGAIAAYRLYLALGDTSYRAKARQIFNWQKAHLVNMENGQVYDNLTSTWASTYNQGTFIGAANFLGDVESATKAADYLKGMGSPTTASGGFNILPDYSVDSDLSGFHGIGLRWAAKFMLERNLKSKYLGWLRANANVALSIRNSAGLSWSQFHLKTPDETMYAWACTNAVVALQVVPPEDPGLAVKVLLPRSSGAETRKARVLIKGTATNSVAAVYLRNKRVSAKKLVKAKGESRWKARVRLAVGMNKIDVMADMGSGKPKRAESIRIRRVPRS